MSSKFILNPEDSGAVTDADLSSGNIDIVGKTPDENLMFLIKACINREPAGTQTPAPVVVEIVQDQQSTRAQACRQVRQGLPQVRLVK